MRLSAVGSPTFGRSPQSRHLRGTHEIHLSYQFSPRAGPVILVTAWLRTAARCSSTASARCHRNHPARASAHRMCAGLSSGLHVPPGPMHFRLQSPLRTGQLLRRKRPMRLGTSRCTSSARPNPTRSRAGLQLQCGRHPGHGRHGHPTLHGTSSGRPTISRAPRPSAKAP